MKLGCILKFIAIIIVILGTSFYLYEKFGKDFISDTTERAKELAIQKIEKLVEDFTEDQIEEPLKEKFAEMLKDVENRKDDYSDVKFEEIISNFNKIIEENDFEETTLDDLEKMIEVKE
ncbi:MAG: hypothetical protein KAI45_06080 [Melioribacteraceae bacterium]|nr:hypothetical protein [Melioribacteraceae bacterium]